MNDMSIYTQDQIQNAKPADRAALKKALAAAVAKFEDVRIPTGKGLSVAVGAARVEFDDQDADRLAGSIRYHHAHAARGNEPAAILNELCAVLTPERCGPLGCHIELMGAGTDSVNYSLDFRVRCPAAA